SVPACFQVIKAFRVGTAPGGGFGVIVPVRLLVGHAERCVHALAWIQLEADSHFRIEKVQTYILLHIPSVPVKSKEGIEQVPILHIRKKSAGGQSANAPASRTR